MNFINPLKTLEVSKSRKQSIFKYYTCQLFNYLILLLTLINTPLVFAEDGTQCSTNECNYTISFDKAGFYIAVVNLPSGQKEGLWSLIIDPPTAHQGSFHGGSILREANTTPSWVGFSLSQPGMVSILPFNYPDQPVPFQLELFRDQGNQQYQPIWKPDASALVNPGQVYVTPSLTPGFYVAAARSTGERDFFGLSLTSPSLYGGVSGGWLDPWVGVGFAAFDVPQPATQIGFKLLFGNHYGELGAGQPLLEVYYQDPQGKRELVWVGELPILPPSELPLSYENTVGNIPISPLFRSSDDGKTSDVESIAVNLYRKQTGKEPTCPSKLAIVRGKVSDQRGQPLADVNIHLQQNPEIVTSSNSAGQFALAIDKTLFPKENLPVIKNENKPVIKYDKEAFLPMEREVVVNIETAGYYINASDVSMVPRSEYQKPNNNRAVDLGRGKLLFP